MRCGWAQHKTDNIVQMDPQILDRVDPTNTNVYVGNLAAHLNGEQTWLLLLLCGGFRRLKASHWRVSHLRGSQMRVSQDVACRT